MAKHGKKYIAASAAGDSTSRYTIEEAVSKLKGASFAKFNESVDVSMRLGVDPRHADQVVRGTVVLPHGIAQGPPRGGDCSGRQGERGQGGPERT